MIRILLLAMLKKNFAVALMIGLACAMFVGMIVGLPGMKTIVEKSFDLYMDEFGVPGITLIVSPFPKERAEDALSRVTGLERVSCATMIDLPVRKPNGRIITGRFVGVTKNDAQTLCYSRRDESIEGLRATADMNVFDKNAFNVADTLALRVGDEWTEFVIDGAAIVAETFIVRKDALSFYEYTDFGYFFMDEDALEALMGTRGVVNRITAGILPNVDAQDALARAVEALGIQNVLTAYTWDDSPAKYSLDSQLNLIRQFCAYVPAMFVLVMLLFELLFFRQFIQNKRAQFGAMSALGCTLRQIVSVFRLFALVVTLLASALGLLLGACVGKIGAEIYNGIYYLPETVGGVSDEIAAATTCAAVAFGQIAVALAMRPMRSETPLRLMRAKPPKYSRQAEQVDRLAPRASASFKLSLAMILRNKARFALSAGCVFTCILIMTASIGLQIATRYVMDNLFATRFSYDARILYKTPVNSRPTDIPGIERGCASLLFQAEIAYQGRPENVVVEGVELPCDMIGIADVALKPIEIPRDGIILEEQLCTRLGVAIGDFVLVNGVSVEVRGIARECTNFVSYCSLAQAAKIKGCEGTRLINSVMVDLADGTDENTWLAGVLADSNVDRVTFTRLQKADSSVMMICVAIPGFIFLAFAIVIGFMVIRNLSSARFLERRRELATLAALGRSATSLYLQLLAEDLAQFLAAILCSLPIARAMLSGFLSALSAELMVLPDNFSAPALIISCAITLLYILAASLPVLRNLKRLDLAQTLKYAD